MLRFQGQLMRAGPSAPRVLLPPRGLHRHRQTVSRKSAVRPPVERERAAAGVDPLYKTQLVNQRGGREVHAAGRDGPRDTFGSIGHSHRSLLLLQPKGGIPSSASDLLLARSICCDLPECNTERNPVCAFCPLSVNASQARSASPGNP